jgi:alkylation response protein AidB-like acyl-CoA dehydrogenase
MSPDERALFLEEWTSKLYGGGWICASWPKEYGGKGLTTMQAVVVAEEFANAGAPMRADFFGDTLVGPTILQWGTEEQKKEFLPKILSGTIAWCQGFSEPDAGSDLANLGTKAVLDGDEWVINGQKIWTTQGFIADYVFVLCRTDPDAPKHKGISYLLCPMDQPGVEVRPIKQIDGSAEFAEVFFTDARCSKDNVVGGLNNGWAVAMTTLGFERGTSATTGYRRFETELNHIIAVAKANGAIDEPLIRQRIALAWSKVQIMRINGLRSLTAVVQNRKDFGVAALGATNKIFWSEYHQQVMALAMDVLGPEAQLLLGDAGTEESVPGYGRRPVNPVYPANALQSSFFFSRSETIWGGTSQIQRNIVGERVLGLPKEPKVTA